MRSDSWGGHVWLALLLAVLAAMLSDPHQGAAFQKLISMLATIEPTAAELAGAIADAPHVEVPP